MVDYQSWSDYWRTRKSQNKSIELAKLLENIRSFAGSLANGVEIIWDGMEAPELKEKTYVKLDPGLIPDEMPIVGESYDALLGQALYEIAKTKYQATTVSDTVGEDGSIRWNGAIAHAMEVFRIAKLAGNAGYTQKNDVARNKYLALYMRYLGKDLDSGSLWARLATEPNKRDMVNAIYALAYGKMGIQALPDKVQEYLAKIIENTDCTGKYDHTINRNYSYSHSLGVRSELLRIGGVLGEYLLGLPDGETYTEKPGEAGSGGDGEGSPETGEDEGNGDGSGDEGREGQESPNGEDADGEDADGEDAESESGEGEPGNDEQDGDEGEGGASDDEDAYGEDDDDDAENEDAEAGDDEGSDDGDSDENGDNEESNDAEGESAGSGNSGVSDDGASQGTGSNGEAWGEKDAPGDTSYSQSAKGGSASESERAKNHDWSLESREDALEGDGLSEDEVNRIASAIRDKTEDASQLANSVVGTNLSVIVSNSDDNAPYRQRLLEETSRYRKPIMDVLSEFKESKVEKEYGLKSGRVTSRHLHRLAAGRQDIFRQYLSPDVLDIDIVVLLDSSNSMFMYSRGADRWSVSLAGALGLWQGVQPQRNADCWLYSYTGGFESVRVTRISTPSMGMRLSEPLKNGTPSHVAIAAVADEVSRLGTHKQRIIIHVTDGEPNPVGYDIYRMAQRDREHAILALKSGFTAVGKAVDYAKTKRFAVHSLVIGSMDPATEALSREVYDSLAIVPDADGVPGGLRDILKATLGR